ncbi:MAG: acetyl-CoA carboxylase biotin carboxyl carrier protein [Alphaproteobacteria bacterium]|nr:acetyl-CoA carboxylase biotin carboxyl carrier protein [Alphaproteobacteria bacterium]
MPKFDVDADMVRKLATLLEETGLNEIEFAEGEKRIRLTRAAAQAALHHMPAASAPVVPQPAAQETAEQLKGTPVTSPMVGTVYLSPEPSAPTFVKVGDKVKQGDTLLIIEAMKVMNPIKAPTGGTVARIMAADAKPVEFGETLLTIE